MSHLGLSPTWLMATESGCGMGCMKTRATTRGGERRNTPHAAISRGAQACGAKVAKHAVGESAPFILNGQRNRCGVFKEPGAEGGCVLWARARSPQDTPTDSVGFLEDPTARAPERSEGSTHRNEVRNDSCREDEAVSGFLGDSPKLH